MISSIEILLIAGIAFMIYSVHIAYKLVKIFSSPHCWFSLGGQLKKIWLILFCFITFFLASYIFFFINIQIEKFIIVPELITAIVFFLGAVFVLIVTKTNYLTYKKYDSATKQVKRKNKK